MKHRFLMFLDHTQRRSTVGRTPLDEWSARRRDLYLTTHDTHNRQISMLPVGFEPTISGGERPQAHRGSRGIALLFHDHGTRRKWGVSLTPRPLFTPGKDPVPIVQEAGWVPGPVWTGAENLAPSGFDPRTVQPVASRYTDYATRPTKIE